MSSSLGMGSLYLIVMLFMARQSTHLLHELSFFETKRTGTAQGERLSFTYPLSMSSCTWHRIYFASSGLVRYGARLGREAPRTRSIWCSVPLLDGSPGGTSSGNTSSYSCNISKIALGKVEGKLIVERNYPCTGVQRIWH
jgi:hypothetical protein